MLNATTLLLVNLYSNNYAGWLPKPHHVLTEFTDDQQSEDDLDFCLEGEEQFFKAAAYYEREHVACCLIWWGTTPNCCSLKAILESGSMCAKRRFCRIRDYVLVANRDELGKLPRESIFFRSIILPMSRWHHSIPASGNSSC